MDAESIQQAATALKNAQLVAVLTGAGVSKESGVPTFRDAQTGLWAQYNPEELATPAAFRAKPKLVWDWYMFRREMVSKAKPNPGHVALADLQGLTKRITVITQNVDDLHEQAGSHDVIHLHGNIARSKCFDDCQGNPTVIDLDKLGYVHDTEAAEPPSCPHCGAWVRPDVVWFTEMLPVYELTRAAELSELCDVMLVVGTSGLVQPAASLPIKAKRAGATVIEVNPDYSMITRYADIKLEAPSGEALPQVIAAMQS